VDREEKQAQRPVTANRLCPRLLNDLNARNKRSKGTLYSRLFLCKSA